MNFGAPGWSFVTNVTTILNPTLTNEFVFGSSKNVLNIDPIDDTFSRKKLDLSYQMPFSDADKLGLIQNWRFDGVPNSPFTGFNGTPFRNFNHTYDFTDTASKVLGTHTFKAGIYLHKSLKDQTAFTSANGNIQFGRDANNPGDTNWAFSNALLGNFKTLQQSNVILNGQYRSWNVEWYAQDNWRVSSKLTLEYGMRFYGSSPNTTPHIRPPPGTRDSTILRPQPSCASRERTRAGTQFQSIRSPEKQVRARWSVPL